MVEPFWKTKTLEEPSSEEWEALCDGCARCCQVKLEDEDTGQIGFTSAVCDLLDIDRCRCTDYPARHVRVPDCIEFDGSMIAQMPWLPDTCAYRLRAEGKDLQWWHPLVSGSPDSVHEAGISVRAFGVPESAVPEEALQDMVIRWGEVDARGRG